jgi:transposase
MSDGSWAGLDVHARSVVASALDERTGELHRARLGRGTEEVVAWLGQRPGPVRVAYEAGPSGYALARALERAGMSCLVAAPSKIARPSGERVKTDQRDAERLMRHLRLGELTGVRVPDEDEEAARDLVRAREDTRKDLMRARNRLSGLLLRHDHLWPASNWTKAHDAWLRCLRLPSRALQVTFNAYYEAVLAAAARRDVLDEAIAEAAAAPRWAPVVGRLACLRGVGLLTAFGLAVEIGDWTRFSGASIGSFLGLVPSEDSSGERRHQGGITKTGNAHARRLLVEASWHQRTQPYPTVELRRRRAGQPPAVRERAERAARRLHRRWVQLEQRRGKPRPVVATAVARELAGWCWSLATMQ